MNYARLFDDVIFGNIESVFRETSGGALISLEHVTPSGNCILHVAAKSGHDQIMKRVLNSLYSHSPLYATNFKGNTALHIAASLGHLGMSQLLITRAIDQEAEVKRLLLKAQNVEQNTALHLAVKHGHHDIVDLLIRNEPGLTSITNKAGESPLFQAVDRGFFEIALRILEISECSDEGRNKMNVLHAAVIRVEIKSRFKTIARDWSQNIQTCLNIFGFPQLQTRRLDITGADFVRKMLDKFPNAIMKADDFGWTPLHYAANFGNFEVVKLFLENNNISLAYERDIQGMSALHISAMKGHCDVMSAIIEKFPYTCELLDNRGRTALHLAAESGRTNAVKILLSSLAFQDLINEQENDEGNTAMHLAAIKGRYKVLRLLARDRRVEKRATNKEGKTVADILQLDKLLGWIEIMGSMHVPTSKKEINLVLMSKLPDRSKALLSLEKEVERQTTEEQIAENEGHEQFKESQRIEPAAKVKGRTGGAANNIVDFEELKKYNVVVMTLITTVTFAALPSAWWIRRQWEGKFTKKQRLQNFYDI
ncbi:ankyrin repeat-containing protein At5g02620-like [Quercus lobata]|uniref:ankyrin repeat-containing protein At5g02620-like n=1 Tax=Quercus lobata TaxID=97700 RepID=UPI001244BE19|nr:ankyrin repeat-containing protein At5g02620-like [Quercus lobata]